MLPDLSELFDKQAGTQRGKAEKELISFFGEKLELKDSVGFLDFEAEEIDEHEDGEPHPA